MFHLPGTRVYLYVHKTCLCYTIRVAHLGHSRSTLLSFCYRSFDSNIMSYGSQVAQSRGDIGGLSYPNSITAHNHGAGGPTGISTSTSNSGTTGMSMQLHVLQCDAAIWLSISLFSCFNVSPTQYQ